MIDLLIDSIECSARREEYLSFKISVYSVNVKSKSDSHIRLSLIQSMIKFIF